MTEQPSRRAADGRLDGLEKRVAEVATDVRSIRDMLISEPAASPLGRRLQADNQELRADYELFLRERFAPLENSWRELRGAWRAVGGVALVLGIIGTFFGLAAWFGFGPQ